MLKTLYLLFLLINVIQTFQTNDEEKAGLLQCSSSIENNECNESNNLYNKSIYNIYFNKFLKINKFYIN